MTDFTTLAEVKQWLGIPTINTTDDALITALISGYTAHVKDWLSRDILSASYTDTYDGFGGNTQPLSEYPVTAVSSVSVNGVAIPPAGSSFTTPGYRFSSTAVILQGYKFTEGSANVAVSYTAGFATVPPAIARAVCELVAFRYREKDRIGLNSKTLSGEITSFITDEYPKSVKFLLTQYKKMVPV